MKTPNGWWFVECDDQHGWVPGTYLAPTYSMSKSQRTSPPSADDTFMAGKTFITRERYVFIDTSMKRGIPLSYEAKQDDELSFPKSAQVTLVESSNDGWPLVEYNDKQGHVPALLLERQQNNMFSQFSHLTHDCDVAHHVQK